MSRLKLLDQVRREIRRRNYSYRTEQAYCRWIVRFVRCHGTLHPSKLADADVENYLNYLAYERNVAAGTQNQALSALVFLYKEVLDKESLKLGQLTRAKKLQKLPTVLSIFEVQQILNNMDGVPLLVCQLLYGAGLRISECLRIRAHDLDFEYNQIWVRQRKEGSPDPDAGKMRIKIAATTEKGKAYSPKRRIKWVWQNDTA